MRHPINASVEIRYDRIAMGRTTTIALIVLAALTSEDCAAGRSAESQPLADVDAFAAVIGALRNGTRPRTISVDVTPLRSSPPATEISRDTRLTVPQPELETRRALAAKHGFGVGDAQAPANCGGIMRPYSPEDTHRGCPREQDRAYIVATAAAPRLDSLPEMFGPRAPAGWYLRVIATSIGSHGYSQRIDDFLLERRSGKWTVVREYPVGYIE